MFEEQPVRGELDGHVGNMLRLFDDYDISLSGETPEKAREQLAAMADLATAEPEPVGTVTDVEIPGPEDGQEPIPGRVYAPAGEGPSPTVVYYHGGGFVTGGLETHDELCRMLANRAEAVIVAPEYRKAPEHPWPAAIKDADATAKWAKRNTEQYGGDPDRLVVAGDSAGGNLAAVVSLMAAERGMPDIARQLLLYPVTAYMEPMGSRTQNGSGYFISAQDLLWFAQHYIDDETHAHHPWAFPLKARQEALAETPPAYVLTAGFDPLRDEGHVYARRLAEAGVDVEYSNYESMVHGFLNMEAVVDRTYDAVEEVADRIDRATPQ